MKDEDKAKEQLIKELRLRIAKLEKSEIQRKQAEELLQGKTENLQESFAEDTQNLVHELKMHQIELEMQNEELHRTQKKLEDSCKRYSDLFEHTVEGIFQTTLDGRFDIINPALAHTLGYESAKEFLSKITNVRQLYIDPSHRDELIRLIQIQESVIGFEAELRRKDGNIIWVSLNTRALRDTSGRVTGLAGTVLDVTELKKAEEALRKAHNELEIRVQERTAELAETNKALQAEITERTRAEESLRTSEALYRSIVESANDIISTSSPDGTIVSLNPAFEKITGWSRAEWLGKSFQPLIHPDDLPMALETFQRIISGEMLPGAELRLLTRSNDYVTVEYAVTPLMKNGKVIGNLSISRDITERKRSEEQIREQAELLDNAQEAIGVRSLEHRLIYWNKGAERLYGWMAEEVIGKDADRLVYKEESPLLIEAKKRVIEKGEWIGELHQVTKDGKEIIVESRWSLIRDNEGKPKSILIINTDITEKKKFESLLLRSQRMESIGTLAGGIAHDLNNVMTPMMLSVEMLKQKFKDEQSQKLLTILEKNSQRGADLIKQVLSFARGVEGEHKPIQITHLVSEIEKVIKETFPKSIEIRIDIQKDLFTISGDATQLHQVLMNLCVNSRDAMPGGGILNITASNFLIDENHASMNTEAKVGSYVVIVVSDTGTGIPAEIIDRIFEPFFTTKEQSKGTGLGLSTSLGIVKSHGGFINVYSEVGKGTKFSVYLPAITTTEGQKAEEKLELPSGQGELILLVDDEAPIRDITRATLEAYGYRVITANDGAEAAALYAQNIEETRVVLMDMAMPNMDGLASIRVLRKINPKVKIIAASGLADKDKLAKVEDISANAFLLKPYTAEKLLKTIHEVIRARRL
ncbi:Chemotaxis protein CheY [uncultured archaeon]|nr:Chemotaxis protein CheY [uncultured archaeon]